MKVILEENQKPHDDENDINGVEFDIREDCVFIQVGNQYIRVDIEEFKKIMTLIDA